MKADAKTAQKDFQKVKSVLNKVKLIINYIEILKAIRGNTLQTSEEKFAKNLMDPLPLAKESVSIEQEAQSLATRIKLKLS